VIINILREKIMARIQTYGLDSTITGEDKIIGTDGAVGADNETKNFTISALKTFINTDISVTGTSSIDGATLSLPNLPTSDPQVSGRLWNDGGTLKISAGA